MLIRDVIKRDLEQEIEEIIKVTQHDEKTVHTEITEYVATKKIREQYRTLFKAIAEAPSEPHEGVGVWISGFFGSGKSAFAKNLGYVLANREVLGTPAADLFKRQLDDEQCGALIDSITARIPSDVVMFDVQVDRAGGGGATSISLYMYRALLRSLGYADDFNIAELEQSLEADGKLDRFIELFETKHRTAFEADRGQFSEQLKREQWRWRFRRKLAGKINEASAMLHEMDPATYESPDSWARTVKDIEVTPGMLVEKTFELAERRRSGKALAFIVDEVGAYVAQSVEKIEDLRAVVEQFGKESKNRVQARQAVAPVWVVVTSQEKLDEVVEALDSKRVELARLRDRFKYEIDLAPADIREVATKRVLGKTEKGEEALAKLFESHEGDINHRLGLERSSRKTDVSKDSFVRFYPYPPHFIDLSIEIMSGIRLQPGAARHLGGSNRTIIKQAYEMLASERTHLAEAKLGRLVTLDLIFELVEGNLSTEKQKDLSDIEERFGHESWEARVAKALTLLEFVRDLPRTETNVAAVLYDEVGGSSPLNHVKEAIKNLTGAEFVRHSPDGFKLQTASEKNWNTERRAIDIRPRGRGEIRREILEEIFSDPKMRSFQFKGLRTFRVGLTVDDIKLNDGQIPLTLAIAEDDADRPQVQQKSQTASRASEHQDEVFWVIAMTSDIDEFTSDLNRSRRMVSKYDQLRAQGKITAEEDACLAAEKNEVNRVKNRLRDKMQDALQNGTGYFRGKSKDGSALGKSVTEVFSELFSWAVPDLYPKLEMGARPLSGKEAEELLVASNLAALPKIFHGPPDGLELITKEGDKYVCNTNAPTAKEILDFIVDRHKYGEKVTGKDLSEKFRGLGYGWEVDLIQLVLAVLLRGGAIEISHQGRRYRDPQDPMARQPLTSKSAFNSSSFAPRTVIDLKTLAAAAEHYEAITGQEVDIEEGAIAKAFKALVEEEHNALLPALATARARNLPGDELLDALRTTLQGVQNASSDDCVRQLADEGHSLASELKQAHEIQSALSGEALATIESARTAATRLWPQIRDIVDDESDALQENAATITDLLKTVDAYRSIAQLKTAASGLQNAFDECYRTSHTARNHEYLAVIDWLQQRTEWRQLLPAEMDPDERKGRIADLLQPLSNHTCGDNGEFDVEPQNHTCTVCNDSLSVIEADRLAVTERKARVLAQLQKLTTPQGTKIHRIRVADLWEGQLTTNDELAEFLERLEGELRKAIDSKAHVILE